MHFVRDVLVFVGLAVLTTAVISSLFPLREGVVTLPACSSCKLKLRGGYVIVQENDSAVLYLGTKAVVKFGWAYYRGEPLEVGQKIVCDPMYIYVVGGIVYVSCDDEMPKIGKW